MLAIDFVYFVQDVDELVLLLYELLVVLFLVVACYFLGVVAKLA